MHCGTLEETSVEWIIHMAEIILRRPNDFGGRLRKLEVFIDGSKVAGLRPNRRAIIEIPPGTHVLNGAMDWVRSQPLSFELKKQIEVEVSLPLMSIVDTFVRPRHAVRVRVVSSTA